MLRRSVEYRETRYHKVPAIIDYALKCAECVRPGRQRPRRRTVGNRPSRPVLDRRSLTEAAVEALGGSMEELSRARAALEASQEAIAALRRSWSWRPTAPLGPTADMTRVRR